MITKNDTIINVRTANLDGNGALRVVCKNQIDKLYFDVNDKNGKRYSFAFDGAGNSAEFPFFIENALLWSVDEPNLYHFSLKIICAGQEENVEGRFGFRTVSATEHEVLLNGSPIFVKGYIRGAAVHDHSNNCAVSELDFYKKNIQKAKEFGFNFVRFHSAIPHEAFFEAADELGILVHLEFRDPKEEYNNLKEMLKSKPELVGSDFIEKAINALYEHPSLAVYCIGNELKNSPAESIVQLGSFIKKTDPTRLFVDTCAWGKLGRENIDIDVQHMGYFFPFARRADMFDTAKSIHTLEESGLRVVDGENPYAVPLIAHEVCHYTALRDFKGLKRKFTANERPLPWWIDEELKMIKEKGFEDTYCDMYHASKYFQGQCWKTAFEAIRRSRLLAGYHFLQFADTDVYENSNGFVDCFDDETYLSAADVLKFNGDKVVTVRLNGGVFKGGETYHAPVYLSNYGKLEAARADLDVVISDGKEVLFKAEKKGVDISRTGLMHLSDIALQMPNVKEPSALVVSATMTAAGKIYCENEWNIWVYPDYAPMSYGEFTSYEKGRAVITDDVEKALTDLAEGKSVCLVYRSEWTRHVRNKTMERPKYAFKAAWNRFKPVIWDRGTNFGGLCDEKTLKKHGFVSGKYYDFNYAVISEDCDKIILDDFPVKPRVIVSGIDKSSRDRFDAYKFSFNLPELMYDRTLRNFGYLFELKVGDGKLLVCGFNMTGLDRGEPTTAAMADFIINYLNSADFAPSVGMDIEELKAYMRQCAQKPVKERMMTQFWALDNALVESGQYWEESRKYLTEE